MQGKHLYEYAVIRLVPKVEREEFFNVGVILFSKRAGYIKSVCQVNEDKLKLYVSEVDRELVFAHLDVFNKICSGAKDGGPIAGTFPLADCREKFLYSNVPSACRFLRRSGQDVRKIIQRIGFIVEQHTSPSAPLPPFR